jgi:hypothetical protein
MPILTIVDWYGRLGNNIVQVINCILVSLYHKNLNVEILSRDFFNTTLLTINADVPFNEDRLIEISSFYYKHYIIEQHSWINSECFTTNTEKMLEILRELFVFKFNDLEPLGPNDLTIHIRSGDIFQGDGSNSEYVVPPLSYYINIINSGNYDTIYLISQDTLNPCINKLIELYPDIKFSINDIVDDIRFIMRSTNIVCSFGTFVLALLNMTDYTKKIYIPSYSKELYDNSCFNSKAEVVSVDLTDYKNKLANWHNTPEQIEFIMTY